MEHGASECVKEQSHTAMPVKTEVDKAAQSTACRGVQTNANFTKEEPGLAELVKSEPALLVKEEVVEDGWRDIAKLQCGPSTSTIVRSTNLFGSVADPGNTLNIKEELGAIDIGPTVLQPKDTQGTTNQKDMIVVKQEDAINHHSVNPILCGRVKEEIIEDEWRGSPTPQDSLMEQPGACTALHSLHKECLETVCRVQLIRLDTFQCDVCDAVFIHAHKLFQHVQDLHGSGPKRSLHVKSPEISIGPQQCATADTDAQRSNKARSQLYSCDKCGKTYSSKNSLMAHNRNLHSTESHECTKCNKKFPSKHYLYNHTSSAHSEQQYECAVCKKMCKSKLALNSHVYYAHRPRPAGPEHRIHICDYCQKTFTKKGTLIIHITSAHASRTYKCSQCNRCFKCEQYLMGHTRRIHPAADTDAQRSNKARSQLYSCDKCGKTYSSKNSLMAHNRNLHSTESHECTKCNKKFPSKHYLYNHTSSAHSEQQYECAVCKKMCKSKLALNSHVYYAHRPRPAGPEHRIHICDYCQKTFTKKGTLIIHITSAHASRTYKCSQCNRCFKCEQYLMGHTRRIHPAADTDAQRSNKARSQLYSCDKCGNTCASKKSLRAHYRSLHSTQSHKCTKCNKKFPSKDYLYAHTIRAHSEQQYECAVCQKTYGSKPALNNHVYRLHRPGPAGLRTHTYTCDYCQKTFSIKFVLRRHIEDIHVGRVHRCRKCNKKFKSSDKLKQHKKSIHCKGRHRCDVCFKLYTTNYALRRHFKKAHNSKHIQFKSDLLQHEMSDSRPAAEDMIAAPSTSTQQHHVVVVKEEPADGELELGPTVFQHMDCNYRPYKEEPQDGL